MRVAYLWELSRERSLYGADGEVAGDVECDEQAAGNGRARPAGEILMDVTLDREGMSRRCGGVSMRGREPDARARNASARRPGPGDSGWQSLLSSHHHDAVQQALQSISA
jgi:hypothetical protein